MDEVLLAVESSDALVARLVTFCDQPTAVAHGVFAHMWIVTSASVVTGTFASPRLSMHMYTLDPDDVEHKYQRFYNRHAHEFDGAGDSVDDEKSHRMHELFQEYEQLLESTIDTFLEIEQLSPEVFYTHCRTLLTSHDDAATNLRLVLAALDIHAFCDLMAREAIATQQARKAAEDMGL